LNIVISELDESNPSSPHPPSSLLWKAASMSLT
jgi:hypothetical protein